MTWWLDGSMPKDMSFCSTIPTVMSSCPLSFLSCPFTVPWLSLYCFSIVPSMSFYCPFIVPLSLSLYCPFYCSFIVPLLSLYCPFAVSHLDSAGIANPHFVGAHALLFLAFGPPFRALGFRIDFGRILGSPKWAGGTSDGQCGGWFGTFGPYYQLTTDWEANIKNNNCLIS